MNNTKLTNDSLVCLTAVVGDAQLIQDKEAAEAQVAFLNSVIVDLQRKNQDVELRLEAMESGAVVNGDSDGDSLKV